MYLPNKKNLEKSGYKSKSSYDLLKKKKLSCKKYVLSDQHFHTFIDDHGSTD